MRSLWISLKILVFAIVFSGACLWADDVQIDMGGSATPVSKASSAAPSKETKTPSLKADTKDTTGVNTDQKNSLEESASSATPMIEQIDVSSEGSGTKVSFNGPSLPEPLVAKSSSNKILVKFPKTKLRIPARIKEDDKLVKDVRSAPHPGTAWIVLDVHGVKKMKLEKTDGGYALFLNVSQPSTENPTAENPPQSSPEMDGTTEKGLFSQLVDASLKPADNSMKLVLTSDGPSKYTVRKLSQPEKIIIHFHNSKLQISEKLKKFKNDDPAFEKGGLVSTEYRQIGPQFSPISEVILTILPGTIYQIDRDLNQVVITLSAPPVVQKPVEKKGNLNQLVSMNLENADLNAVIKTLAGESGFELNLVSGPVSGTINEKFKDVPLKTALGDLLAPGGYNYEVQGNTLRVGPQAMLVSTKALLPHVTDLIAPTGGMTPQQFDTLVRPLLTPGNASTSEFDTIRNMIVLTGTSPDIEDYKRAIRDLKLDASTETSRITRVVKLNYADPAEMNTILSAYLTPVGKIQVSGFRLVIWENASNMGTLLELINELDRKPPQVLIESNIVEVDSEADLNLGVQWDATKATGDPTVTGTIKLLPTNALTTPGAISFGTVKAGINLNTTLEALESHKKGKIISRPRIATANGTLADINEVENVVLVTQTQTFVPNVGSQIVTSSQNLPLPIDLKVTPRITDDGRITTVINASITSQTGQPPVPGQLPPTSVQTASTKITTKNGETIVIGGLVREVAQDVTNGIPLLSSIPIIGSLFQDHEKQTRKEELVIFITPTLLED